MQSAQVEEWITQVRDVGLRATPGRIAALRFLDSHPHSTAAEIQAGIADKLPSLSTQSVHNVVNDLSEKGLLRRVEVPGAARYETRSGDNHHHLLCVVCGRIEDVDCVEGQAPCLSPGDSHGMSVLLSAEVTFRAVCADCEKTWDQSADTPTSTAHVNQPEGML